MHALAKHRFAKGTFFMVLSATSLALSYLLVKLKIDEVNFFYLLFLRFLFPFFIVLAIALLAKGSVKTKNLKAHVLRAFFVVIAQYSLFYYISKSSLLNATVLLNTSPLFIPLIEGIFLNYRIPKSTWIASGISLVGVVFLLQPGLSLFSLLSFFGLLAGVCIAASQVIFGLNAQRESLLINIFYLYLFGTLFSFIPLPFLTWQTPSLLNIFAHKGSLFWLTLLWIGVFNLFNQAFRGKAYHYGKPSTLSTFLYLSVLISGLLDWFVFKSEPNGWSLAGATLVLLGSVAKIGLRYLFLKRKAKEKC